MEEDKIEWTEKEMESLSEAMIEAEIRFQEYLIENGIDAYNISLELEVQIHGRETFVPLKSISMTFGKDLILEGEQNIEGGEKDERSGKGHGFGRVCQI